MAAGKPTKGIYKKCCWFSFHTNNFFASSALHTHYCSFDSLPPVRTINFAKINGRSMLFEIFFKVSLSSNHLSV